MAIWAGCLLWLAAVVALLVVLAPVSASPSADEWLTLAGCTALALAFGSARMEYRRGRARLEIAPDAGFLVLVAIVAAPPWALLAGMVAATRAPGRGATVLDRVFHAGTGALATGMASLVAHETFTGDVPAGREVLIAATAAAIVRSIVLVTGQLLLAESRVSGGALAVLRTMPIPTILTLEAALPAVTVSMAAPFLDEPVLAMLVVLAGQLLTWRVLRIQHEQFVGVGATRDLLDAFHRYVPRHVADAVLADGGNSAAVPHGTGASQRELTVLFIDVRGFTSWSERTPPDDVFRELNRLLGDLADAILATDGTLDKFTGDGLMAFWNAPTDQPDHAALAVQALPKLLMRVREFNIRREVRHDAVLEVGIGIATGPAMVGDLGHHSRLAYTAIGDTVNRAARLEQATRTCDVPALLDEATFLALPLQLQRQLTRLDGIEVKGRSERVRTYAPTTLVQRARGIA